MSVIIRRGFCGKGPTRHAKSISARKLAAGSPIIEIRAARSIRVDVLRDGQIIERNLTLYDAHNSHRHQPEGIRYRFRP